MSGFSLPTNFVENPEKLVRRVRPRIVPPPISQSTSKPTFQAPSTELMAEKTLCDFSVPSAANVATGPNVDVGDVNFELKSNLINMVQASSFCGKPNEDANAHLQNFLELCKTVTIRGITADAIRLRLFPFSLQGKAKQWFYQNKEAISTWDKCSTAFLAKFSCWAKQMSYMEEFQVSNRQRWNPSQKLGRDSKNTYSPVFTMGWTSGSCSKASTMG